MIDAERIRGMTGSGKRGKSRMLYLKNGYLIDPISKTEGYRDLWIDGEKGIIRRITEVGSVKEELLDGYEGEVETLDLKGRLVAPGLVDAHVHFRDPGFTYKEDICSGARAAARGGFTSVVLMANTKPPVDTAETLAYVLQKGKGTEIHVYSCANVTREMAGKELTDMEGLYAAGAVGFTDDGIPLMEEEVLQRALAKAAALGCPVSLHEENPRLIVNNGINAGEVAAHLGIVGSPREAEISMVSRDLQLAQGTGAELVIQHISTKEAVELVRQAKKANPHIHAEAAPHHFTLTQEAVLRCGTLAKMNPPLRLEEDRLAVIKGLQDGTIDMIATDHAPHSTEEKEKPLTEAPSGIIGLETAFSLGIRELVQKGYLTMSELIYRMSSAPAKLYGLDAGYLAEGGPADLVVFDKDKVWTAGEYCSRSSNSPFTGEILPGVVAYTICRGRIVYRG